MKLHDEFKAELEAFQYQKVEKKILSCVTLKSL